MPKTLSCSGCGQPVYANGEGTWFGPEGKVMCPGTPAVERRQGVLGSRGGRLMDIVVHIAGVDERVGDASRRPLIGTVTYACPNCGNQLHASGACSSCPTWARGPGLRPYPPRNS